MTKLYYRCHTCNTTHYFAAKYCPECGKRFGGHSVNRSKEQSIMTEEANSYGATWWRCSVCNRISEEGLPNYCENCGAKVKEHIER